MPLIDEILLILCCNFILLCFIDFFTEGNITKAVGKSIDKHRKRKHPQLFSYINFFNKLAESCNEVFEKEYLPNRKKINYFYDNVKYFPQDGMKSRQLELERQKQLLEDAEEDMGKIWDNAQEYYKLIKEYTKAHKILWVNEYLSSFPSF